MKKIIFPLLIVFVCFSIGYLIYSEARKSESSVSTDKHKEVEASNSIKKASVVGAIEKGKNNKVIVYYFHGVARCATCIAIEQYTKEAVQTELGDKINTGEVEFKSINVEEPENEHFIQDFQMSFRCVVVERVVDGERKDWKRLEEVWNLVHKDKSEFYHYIQENVRQYL
ncbi:MAG TPA: nitrophenyl compound nitroreductase subunit ArsF family protein [Candidatus Hydrogenedens sp.]|nr:nitrophenyl compound nitroreductase subunit ArsF family protein [Candidatus Hydrogenedens sp.]